MRGRKGYTWHLSLYCFSGASKVEAVILALLLASTEGGEERGGKKGEGREGGRRVRERVSGMRERHKGG